MPLFDRPDWPAYKAALHRIAETGSELERAEVAGAPGAEMVEQQFQEAVLEYRQARAGLSDGPLPEIGDLADGPGDHRTDRDPASLAGRVGRQGDGPDRSGRRQQG